MKATSFERSRCVPTTTSSVPSESRRRTPLHVLGRAEAGEEVDRDRKRREATLQRPEVLVGEDRRRREEGGLLPVEDALEEGPHRDLGLPVADVAAEEPVHRLVRLHVALHVADRRGLVGRLRELERVLELLLPR